MSREETSCTKYMKRDGDMQRYALLDALRQRHARCRIMMTKGGRWKERKGKGSEEAEGRGEKVSLY
jgi:hypothetical protein